MKIVKNVLNVLSNFINSHGGTIIAVLICTLFFLTRSLVKDIQHTTEIFEAQAESVEIFHQLESSLDLIQQQSDAVLDRDEQLAEANSVLRMQSMLIEKMVDKLKELKSWPLKIKPVNPSDAI